MFNIENTTHINLYLQAGQSPEARQSREDMIGKELLDYLLLAKPKIILGGDFNCVCSGFNKQRWQQNLQQPGEDRQDEEDDRHLQEPPPQSEVLQFLLQLER